MGKQAATKVRAGAEGAGAGNSANRGPTLRLVDSPKRQRILEGMLDVVGERGYEAASVRMVLDSTGLYRQAFYDNFADVEVCYLEALDFGSAQMEAVVRAAGAPQSSWRGKLRAGLSSLL
jgi:AcrR family transcriptional regulator